MDELFCIQYDEASSSCGLKKEGTSCKGCVSCCEHFKVHVGEELCVFTSCDENTGEEKIEGMFFVGEGYEQRGMVNEALESYKRALDHYVNNNFIKQKLGIEIEEVEFVK